jgi:hypothetical protein
MSEAPVRDRDRVADPLRAGAPGRDETALERCDRNLLELLQEVRVVQTGVQVMFAFLLTAPLSARFPQLTGFQRGVYFTTLVACGATVVLLITPSAHHRILFRLGDKEHLVRSANSFTLAGLLCLAVAIVGSLVLVCDLMFPPAVTVVTGVAAAAVCAWFWALSPLRRRRQLNGGPPEDRIQAWR